LPEELRHYFLALNGTGTNQFDKNFIAFWPIDEMTLLSDCTAQACDSLLTPQNWFVFADYSIGIIYYAINFDTCEVVGVRSGWKEDIGLWPFGYSIEHPTTICVRFANFGEFVTAYIESGFAGIV